MRPWSSGSRNKGLGSGDGQEVIELPHLWHDLEMALGY